MYPEFIVVITTTSQKEDANKIAKTLLAKKLAGCIQIIGPMTSHYYWENEICQDDEWMCLIKSSKQNYEAIETTIQKIHPYDVPEIITLPIIAGSKGYLNWLSLQLKQD